MRDRLYDVPGEWRLRACSNSECGLVWLDPTPLDAEIPKLYRDYFTHQAEENRLQRLYRWSSRGLLAATLGYAPAPSWAARLLGRLLGHTHVFRDGLESSVLWVPAGRGKLLDVGCGSGVFLSRMRELGWQVYGVEPDPKGAETARSQGIDVRTGTLESVAFPASEFDVITMSHVLEHLPRPTETLAECRRVLKPGGRLHAVTPNSQSRGAATYGRHWLGWDSPRHLMVFTVASLRAAAITSGLTVRQLDTTARMSWLVSRISQSLARHPKAPGVVCPFEPWLMISALLFHLRESTAARGANRGEELRLVAERV